MMLAILFGLSMDYQVFLVSRMHEEWVDTEDNGHSVRIGQAATGRVITAAATIMILVFSSFLLAGQRVIAEFGIGLASAVFLDAFILRTILVPAVMHISGTATGGSARPRPRAAARGGGGRRVLAGGEPGVADRRHVAVIGAAAAAEHVEGGSRSRRAA